MPIFPLLTRYKLESGGWSAPVHADTLEQAREHLKQYRKQGYTEFQIEDARGQSFTEDDLNAPEDLRARSAPPT